MLAFLSSSPNIPGVGFSLDSSIFTAWLLEEEEQEEDQVEEEKVV